MRLFEIVCRMGKIPIFSGNMGKKRKRARRDLNPRPLDSKSAGRNS